MEIRFNPWTEMTEALNIAKIARRRNLKVELVEANYKNLPPGARTRVSDLVRGITMTKIAHSRIRNNRLLREMSAV